MEMNQSFLIILLRPSEKQTLYWVIKPFFFNPFLLLIIIAKTQALQKYQQSMQQCLNATVQEDRQK